ncbi:Sec20-domain-containing protein [Lentinula edodes]|uniref:Sec20-domain-containing protein n=1 Tax=Lentinula edodes TaxID=5353 RepID=A0A1Q3ENZ2_LENED|nr:Sec20-domain-containing protein [Lentinula edodes]
MPPLSPIFTPEAAQVISSIRRRELDISNVQIPRLKTCLGPLSLQHKLSTELREDIDVFARQIETLDAMVDDQKGSKSRRELRVLADEFNQTLSKTIVPLCYSQSAQSIPQTDVNEKVTEDAVMQANNDVTEALQRTLSLMQGELERSVLTTQMLDSSISTLRATSSTHDVLSNAMDASKQLITALQKSDRMDRLLIFFGLILFFLSVSIVLKERVLDRSVRLAFWWTRFLPSGKSPVFISNVSSSVVSGASTCLPETTIIAYTSSVLATATAAATSLTSILLPTPESASDGDFLSSGTVDFTQALPIISTELPSEPPSSSTTDAEKVFASSITVNPPDEL